ncbi:MAG: hypothetical protein IKQ89_11290 [Muribaculaceae bacterium]|nr:hypothetical protein [Muribaculaceae bacterium]
MVKSLGNIVIFLLLMLLPLPLRAASDTTVVAVDSLRHQLPAPTPRKRKK